MGAALLRYRLLAPSERLGVMMAGIRMLSMRRRDRPALEQLTVAALLTMLRQGARARRCFWHPLAIATLNENPELASAALLAEVVSRTMFSRRFDSAFGYAQVGLSELYCTAAASFIERHGGLVARHALVERIELDAQGTVARVRLRDGRALGAANFVAAVPPDKLLRLLPERVAEDPAFARLAGIGTSPIICVHLWLDREVIQSPFAGFIGTTTQWLFNKRRILQDSGGQRQGYLSFVISGARKLVDSPADELIKLVTEDLHAVLPSARASRILNALAVKEKQATIAPDPGSGRLRPPVQTPLDNFFLAGDWIATGLPATIESAVIAGRAAAEAVARRVGQASGERLEPEAAVGAA
jgi:squalene-associated FAD-dependent desaturase